jgi:hypothetical protein
MIYEYMIYGYISFRVYEHLLSVWSRTRKRLLRFFNAALALAGPPPRIRGDFHTHERLSAWWREYAWGPDSALGRFWSQRLGRAGCPRAGGVLDTSAPGAAHGILTAGVKGTGNGC